MEAKPDMGQQVRNFTKYESIKSSKQGTGYRTGEKKKKETRPNYSLSVGDIHQNQQDKCIEIRKGVGKIWAQPSEGSCHSYISTWEVILDQLQKEKTDAAQQRRKKALATISMHASEEGPLDLGMGQKWEAEVGTWKIV